MEPPHRGGDELKGRQDHIGQGRHLFLDRPYSPKPNGYAGEIATGSLPPALSSPNRTATAASIESLASLKVHSETAGRPKSRRTHGLPKLTKATGRPSAGDATDQLPVTRMQTDRVLDVGPHPGEQPEDDHVGRAGRGDARCDSSSGFISVERTTTPLARRAAGPLR